MPFASQSAMPKPLKMEFWQDVLTYEEARKMTYITSIERIGYDRGKQEGRQEVIIGLLRQNLPLEVVAQATGCEVEELKQLQKQLSVQG
jgi:predicted transposase YdaD